MFLKRKKPHLILFPSIIVHFDSVKVLRKFPYGVTGVVLLVITIVVTCYFLFFLVNEESFDLTINNKVQFF